MSAPEQRCSGMIPVFLSAMKTLVSETIHHTFSGSDGKIPYGTLILDKAGNLYGTTYQGGAYGGGVLFKIAPE
jgi:uncharacterized repeat protein (TIGR03803 family)